MAANRHNRYLIVNADDFGQSSGVNQGIIEAHEHGIVTSASLMVRWPAAAEASAYSRKHPDLSLGLHFDFGEWACRKGNWVKLYEAVPEDDAAAVAKEVSRQLAAFRRQVGKDPTHIDSHQHAHRGKPVRAIFTEIADKLGVPLRGCSPRIRYCGGFYGQTSNGRPLPSFVSFGALIKILAKLRPGFTELSCHPGRGDDLDSMYLSERAREVKALCDPRVRAAIVDMGIKLCSFRDAAIAGRRTSP
jgi:chitin disaccharide deacetylase